MMCKNICEKYRAVKSGRTSYYEEGCKRCQICEIFITRGGNRCPCCKSVLRTKPRNRH
jgi:hypothetical protein